MEKFSLAQLTNQTMRLRLMEADDPARETRRIVSSTLKVYLKGLKPDHPQARQGAKDVARGAMTALLREYVRLSVGAVAVLRGVEEAARELGHNVPALVTSALEGIATIARVVPADAMSTARAEIESEFVDAGRVFDTLLSEQSAYWAQAPRA